MAKETLKTSDLFYLLNLGKQKVYVAQNVNILIFWGYVGISLLFLLSQKKNFYNYYFQTQLSNQRHLNTDMMLNIKVLADLLNTNQN